MIGVLAITAVALLAQPITIPPTGQEPTQSVTIEMVAIQGVEDPSGGAVSEELKGMRKVLKELAPLNKFTFINTHAETFEELGQEKPFPINGIYTAYVRPNGTVEAEEGQGQLIDLEARVEMLQGDRYVDALRTRAETAPGQGLLFRGMELGQGELVVFFRVKSEDDEGQGDSSDSDQEQDSEESEEDQESSQGEQESDEQEQESMGEGEDAHELKHGEGEEEEEEPEGEDAELREIESEGESAQPQESSGDEQEVEPKDLQNIDALLESLEEVDRRAQQKEAKNQRKRVKINGDWW